MLLYLFAFLFAAGTLEAYSYAPPSGRYVPYTPPYKEYVDNNTGDQPLITAFSYRSIADHIIDQSIDSFDPDVVQLGDIIYVNVWYLDWFQGEIHPRIRYPYLLICCDVGAMVPHFGELKNLLYDPKLAAWFGKNMAFSCHPKLHQIAMGHNDLLGTDFRASGADRYLLNLISEDTFEKQHLLYMNHYPRKFGDRDKVVRLFENAPYCFTRQRSNLPWERTRRTQYFDEMAASKFVISPIGLEIDCVRNWEAFSLHCIPIVEHTFLDRVYEGLPIVFVNNYKEVNQKFLENKWDEIHSKPLNYEKAFFDYWHKLIKGTQEKVRRNPYCFSSLDATLFHPQDLQDLKSIIFERPSYAPNGKFNLVCLGSLMTLRPFQLGKELTAVQSIYLYDPWITASQEIFHFQEHVNLSKKIGVTACSAEHACQMIDDLMHDVRVFVDLTYFRSSLNLNRQRHPRHTLKDDLNHVFEQMHPNMLLCGNMLTDPYVSEVLQKFAEENSVDILEKGNFWYCYK